MASTDARRGHLRIVSGLELPLRPLSQAGRGLGRVVSHRVTVALIRELLALAVLIGAIVAVFWPMLAGIGVYAESDTFTFFYPVFAQLHASLRDGELPLWTPNVFGGFPLFAEGQIGALYPPAILAAQLASPVEGFLLLRVFHVAVAVFGAFALARALGISAVGGTIGGLTFGFGSFVIAQQHHANLLAATVWLPLLFACIELGLARQGWIGHGLLGVAALILGIQALATHVQPLMLTGAMLAAYIVTRQAWMAIQEMRAAGLRRGGPSAVVLLMDASATTVFVGAVGMLIAAAQILPLYELSQESWRAHGWSYQDAIEYSLPPVNLLTLLFPFFFRLPDGGQWSLWQIWESVIYVGVVPLVLAVVAAVAVRRWAVTFFAVTALISAFFALGGYAPYGLYEWLWHIPGMSLQRAPARFLLITTLGLSVLAAYGADWIAASAVAGRGRDPARRRLLVVQIAVVGVLALVAVHLVFWRAWVQADRAWAMQVLAQTYLALPKDPLQLIQPMDVVLGLESALDLANPKTMLPLVVLGLLGLLLVAWRELPRLRPAWQSLLVLLVVADLTLFASDFHPLVDVSYLGDPGPAGRALVERAGRWRVLTRPDVETPQPNELLPHGIAEASGYSPLQLERHRWYAQSVQTVDNVLLDLWSIRWIVETSRPEPMPSYQLVSFHPRRPLMIGGVDTPNGEIVLKPEPSPATQLRLITALSGGETIGDGEIVGEWLLTGADGVRQVLPMRAGREIADWRPRVSGQHVAHRPVQTAATIPVGDSGTVRTLGYAELPLARRGAVASLQYRHVNPVGRTILYGVGLYDRDEDSTSQVTREDRYAVVYRDTDVTVYENAAAYPRAFVVPEAVLAPDGPAAMARLRDGPLDPRRQVVVESVPDGGVGPFTATPPTDATVVAEGSAVIDLRADAPGGGFLVLTDPYYPGWKAYVNGVETPILRADYLFRAIALPPGSHEIRFIFVPSSLQRGTILSAAGLVIAVSAILVGMLAPLASRRRWPRWRSVRRLSQRLTGRMASARGRPADRGGTGQPPSDEPPATA